MLNRLWIVKVFTQTASNPYSPELKPKQAGIFISYAISLSLLVSEGEINSELVEIVNKTLIPTFLTDSCSKSLVL